MPNSKILHGTRERSEQLGKYKKNRIGKFDATTTIGFNAVSFDYISKVEYNHPVVPINFNEHVKSLGWRVTSVADSSRIFNSMKSEWKIKPNLSDPYNKCIVDYKIEMEFES